MSQWTHIAGSIRYDGLQAQPGMEHDPRDFLGSTCTSEDSREKGLACDVPCGSEGSLQYKVWVNPDTSHLAAYNVVFWGDLRDYDDVGEIAEYFERITRGRMVRGGAIRIDVEGRAPVVLSIDDDDGVRWMYHAG